MGYRLSHDRCNGTWQGVHCGVDGTSKSRRFDTQQEAVGAIHAHHGTGRWPREVEETEVEICPTCGQVIPTE